MIGEAKEKDSFFLELPSKLFPEDFHMVKDHPLVDVHCHLTDPSYTNDIDHLMKQCELFGLKRVVTNGLCPTSNRGVLTLARKYPMIVPATGIYPLQGIHHHIPINHPLKPESFSVSEEIGWIEEQASQGVICAVGECGLDGYHFGDNYLTEQIEVFERLINIALTYDLPLIVHSRKCEKKVMTILAKHRVLKAIFHCYMGKTKLAIQGAEEYGWYFSMPAIAPKHSGFCRLMTSLPVDQILTETDSPYLPYQGGIRNDPRQVAYSVVTLAYLRGWSLAKTSEKIWQNYCRIIPDNS
ncbi:MAG: TatD family hydrolase [Proteobacteria bacterium]|nr:TatD family hydrolase [Pseudomonadota bacterium]